MSDKNIYQKLGYRIAGEVQLLAEEKWIIEALSKIKKQRNSLQIERLHLESLKAQLKSTNESQTKMTKTKDLEAPTTSAVDLMQNANSGNSSVFMDFKIPESNHCNEANCNDEELNFMVNNSMFSNNYNPQHMEYNMEEDESDADEADNIVIDINMLMNGYDQNNSDMLF